MLNNEVYGEASSALAAEVLARANASDRDRIRTAAQRCLSRQPTSEELHEVGELLRKAREYYAKNRDAAEKVVGTQKRDWLDFQEHAAWSATLRTLLNLDEFITRD